MNNEYEYECDVYDGEKKLGLLNVTVSDNEGIKVHFNTTNTLKENAHLLDADHFNWYQVVIQDTHPPSHCGLPYIDPPKGGFPKTNTFGAQWADNLIWYWDEKKPCHPNSHDGYHPSLELENNIWKNDTVLNYEDHPTLQAFGASMEVKTWLAAIDKESNLKQWLLGFHWKTDLLCNQQQQYIQKFYFINFLHEIPDKELYNDLKEKF